jgi:prolyl 4-hydroxylase
MTSTTASESKWRHWILHNLLKACTQESIVSAMAEKDVDPQYARSMVAQVASELDRAPAIEPRALPTASKPTSRTAVDAPLSSDFHEFLQGTDKARAWMPNQGYVYEPIRVPQGNIIRTSDRAVPVVSRLAKPEICVFADFLSPEECDSLIERAREKLARSTVVDQQTGESAVIQDRTSFGTCFRINEADFIGRIEQRIAELVGWPVEHGEGLQILRYRIGGEYKPHFDYFPPMHPGNAGHLANGGQRVATFLMYLNDVEDGGETIFPEIGLSMVPRRGQAVYFSYCNSQNQFDPLTLHGGAPVRRGEKWLATKWLRQNPRV